MYKKYIVLLVSIFSVLFNLCTYVGSQDNSELNKEMTIEEMYEQAYMLRDEKRLEETLEVLDKLLGKKQIAGDERFYSAYYMKAQVLQHTERIEESLEITAQMKEEYTSNDNLCGTYSLEATTYLYAGKNEKAIENFKYVIENSENPNLVESAKTFLISTLQGAGRFEEAIKMSEEDEDGAFIGIAMSYGALADSYIKQGREEEAMRILEEASNKLSDGDKTFIDGKIASLLQKQGKYKEMFELIRKRASELPKEQQEEILELIERVKKMEGYKEEVSSDTGRESSK